MRICTPVRRGIAIGIFAGGTLLPAIAVAQASQGTWEAGQWRFGATVYAYLPR